MPFFHQCRAQCCVLPGTAAYNLEDIFRGPGVDTLCLYEIFRVPGVDTLCLYEPPVALGRAGALLAVGGKKHQDHSQNYSPSSTP